MVIVSLRCILAIPHTSLTYDRTHGAWAVVESYPRGRPCSVAASIAEERRDAVPVQPTPAVQKRQLDQERRPDHLAAESLHQVDGRADRAAGRQQIVHHQNALPILDGVSVQLQG